MQATFADELTRDQASLRLRTALSLDGDWLPTVLQQAHQRLASLRAHHHDAGGLIIATDQDHAHGIAQLLRDRIGTPADVVVSDDPTASRKITQFAHGDGPWLVAVRMVSEGVDIPRLRVGVYATTTSTELFFRQAVGRFVRWQRGRSEQQAYVYLPDDPRLRSHAFAIAESRRHVMRAPRHDEASDDWDLRSDHLAGDVPEQLSLFSVVSATATGVSIHAITEHGLQQFDDERPVPEPDDVDPDPTLAVELPTIPTPAGTTVDGRLSVAEQKDDLRVRNAEVSRLLVDLTGWNHARVNAEMNRLAGVAKVSVATADQLERRLRYAESWLRRLRGR